MRILAINQYYAPDHAATAQLLAELGEELVRRGHEFSVVTSRGSYEGGNAYPASENLNGVEVRRVAATSFGKGSIWGRLTDYISFWGNSLFGTLRIEQPHVIIALTTPPMVGAVASLAALVHGVPLITWNQDIYPEVAGAFGVMKESSKAYRGFLSLAKLTHARTTFAIALSPGMAERLRRQGCPKYKIRVSENWSDGEAVRPVPHESNPFRIEHKIKADEFVIMYSGNLGQGHDYETLITGIKKLKALNPALKFRCLFVGGGAKYSAAQSAAEGIREIEFLPYQPKEKLGESLSAADVHLVSLEAGLEGLLVPSKMYGIMAVGRALCFVGPKDCEVSSQVEESDLGASLRNGDSDGLAQALLELAEGRAAECGKRARALLESRFDKKHAVDRIEKIIREATVG